MGVWCNDSINGSNPFGRGLNPLTPAKKIKKSALKFLYVKKLLYLCSRFVINNRFEKNGQLVEWTKARLCKSLWGNPHIGSNPILPSK